MLIDHIPWQFAFLLFSYKICKRVGFPDGSVVKDLPTIAGDMGLIPGSRRSSGEGNGNPFQNSAWEKPWTEESGP